MTEVLIVVDVQVDFCAGGALEIDDAESLIAPLNKTIQKAVDLGMLIIFTRDWHPENHSSFEKFGGQWPVHCVQNTPGAHFHSKLIVPDKCQIVDKGTDSDKDGYSPYENPMMAELVNQTNVKTVYVAGIALEYCVRATCLDTIKHGKRVVAIEPLIRSISEDKITVENQWNELVDAGVVRERRNEIEVLRLAQDKY